MNVTSIDPHPALLQRRAALYAEPVLGEVPPRIYKAIARVERQLAKPARTLAGVLAQLEFVWSEAEHDTCLTADARRSLRAAMETVRKMAAAAI